MGEQGDDRDEWRDLSRFTLVDGSSFRFARLSTVLIHVYSSLSHPYHSTPLFRPPLYSRKTRGIQIRIGVE